MEKRSGEKRGNCENGDIEAKKKKEGKNVKIAESKNKEEVNFNKGLDGDKNKGITVLDS